MSSGSCNERELIRTTNKYWRLDPADQAEGKLAWYVEHLLPKELGCAQQRNRLPDEGCEVLALMLGFSVEPLLQVIAAYKPQRVLMIVNNKYNVIEGDGPQEVFGKTFYDGRFSQAFELLVNHSLLERAPEIFPDPFVTIEAVAADDDEPVMVFRFLRRHLLPLMRGDGNRVRRTVIDITGAKKSMVAGAYLFATFADVPVSYVDFEYYDPEKSRPYGFTCKIGEMQSPSRTFRLREWERVRELYRRHAFGGAADLLNSEILPAMEGYFDSVEITAARKMAEVLKMYEFWDNGDHSRAFEEAKRLFGEDKEKVDLLPPAVTVLGSVSYWPQGDDSTALLTRLKEVEETGRKANEAGADDHPILYLDMQRLVAYACDEMGKINRLIKPKEDYRSAFLRAGGLLEVLLRARLLILLECGKVQVAADSKSNGFIDWESLPDEVKQLQPEMKNRIILGESIFPPLQAVRYQAEGDDRKKCGKIVIKKEGPEEGTRNFFLRRSETAPRLPDGVFFDEDYKNLRNKAIHTYLSIPPAIADKAKQIARASVNDFAQNWAPLMRDCAGGTSEAPTKFCVTRMTWQLLCDMCGISFLPPRHEEAKEDEK